MSKNNVDILTLKEADITDFAKSRNKLLNGARSDWVFFVDSDEVVTPELKKEVEFNNGSGIFDGFYVKRMNYFLGRYVGTDRVIRYAKRNAGKWRRKVHEVWEIKGKVGELKNPLIHNTAVNVSDMVGKVNKYSTLHAAAHKDENKKTSVFKIIFFPIFKFTESVILGKGLILSTLQSFHSFLAWSKQWEFQKN